MYFRPRTLMDLRDHKQSFNYLEKLHIKTIYRWEYEAQVIISLNTWGKCSKRFAASCCSWPPLPLCSIQTTYKHLCCPTHKEHHLLHPRRMKEFYRRSFLSGNELSLLPTNLCIPPVICTCFVISHWRRILLKTLYSILFHSFI